METFKILVILAIILSIFYFVSNGYYGPTATKNFAKCLTDKGIIMYGVDSCHFCTQQKQMFGNNFIYINYVNCDSHKEECIEAGIRGYPTWLINTTLYPGKKSLDWLANASGCKQ